MSKLFSEGVARPRPKGRKRKNKSNKDGSSDFEFTAPTRLRHRGQVRGSKSCNSTIATERGKLDSGRFLRYLM